jgi:ABC-type multidrug transport system fused ATPase/permease subunit
MTYLGENRILPSVCTRVLTLHSAVDAHVGRQLFEEALIGDLGRGRTRILVTHHFGLVMPKTEYAVILGEGTVQHAGSVEELQRTGVLGRVMRQEQKDLKGDNGEEMQGVNENLNGTLHEILSNATERSHKFDSGEIDVQGKSKPKKFTEDEKREKGAIKIGIYREYLTTSGGVWFWLPIMCLYVVYQGVIVGRSWFVGYWTRSYKTESALLRQFVYQYGFQGSKIRFETEAVDHDLSFYLGIYVGLSMFICIFGTLRYFLVFLGAIRASKRLFDKLTYAVLRAPLRWLDITPVGRILNRFTADFAAIDSRLGNDFGFMLYQGVLLAGIVAAGLFVSPWMLLIAAVLLIICALITRSFLAGAREVKVGAVVLDLKTSADLTYSDLRATPRVLYSNSLAPFWLALGPFVHSIKLMPTLKGMFAIQSPSESRSHGSCVDMGGADVCYRMFDKVDTHAKTFWHIWLFNRWLALRLNFMGACFAILVAAVIVYSGIEASLAGFALSFALQYSSAIVWAARCYANVELSMNAVERVTEYSNNPIEDQGATVDIPAVWPTEGRIEVSGFVAGYAPDLPPVLKGLSFTVEKNQRIGVVGRTGAGKSSLTLALFRFLEAREGSIHIDGIDISTISLHALRSSLAIIPQDPVLFSGTVRSNLDAFDDHSDAELYEALERVHLIRSTGHTSRDEPNTSRPGSSPALGTTTPANPDTNTNIFRSLSSRISEGGLNLSQGQRQLLCLARAIVSRPKIMVLDEATSAVDMATDALIQRSIRDAFQDSTLVVIAHRLSTIADFDRILVMEDGRAVEFGEPGVLMGDEGGVFRGMVEQSGEVAVLRDVIGGLKGGDGDGEGKGKGRVG